MVTSTAENVPLRMFIVLSGENFLHFVEEQKRYTEEAMKIDMAPWATAYTEVDMDKLYTELTLEKLENTPASLLSEKIENYQKLFGSPECGESQDDKVKSKANFKKKKGKRILCKGDPGMGKTTWGKKIGYDWAKGIFTAYSIVFFVFLKLVQPDDTIENVIIEQNPHLEGLRMSPANLRRILEIHSEKCLVILDGLDEHVLGRNGNVIRIIRAQELFYCNVVVTSRPNSTKDIERYFPTIIRVQGFTKDRARQFSHHLLNSWDLVETVVDFRPSNEVIYDCPIILLILCILVKEDKFDLRSETLEKGYLYFKLTRFLYQKYASTHGLDFNLNDFMKVLAKLGKLAWQTLKSGNPFLKRSQVIEEVGEDAFKYGLLIGHEDFRLIGKYPADILITYPHRTIQEFLGSFYFVLMIDEGQKIENLIDKDDRKTTKFMVEPLFLHFCLWFLFSDQTEIPLENKAATCNCFFSYVSKQLDLFSFDLEVIGLLFPAFDLDNRGDNLIITFLGTILRGLKNLKHLRFLGNHPVDSILAAIGPKLRDLSSVTIHDQSRGNQMFFDGKESKNGWVCIHENKLGQLPFRKMMLEEIVTHVHCDDGLDIVLKGSACSHELLHTILDHCKSCDIYPSVFLTTENDIYLSHLFRENMQQVQRLFIINCSLHSVNCSENIPPCPRLTHLYVVKANEYTAGAEISLMMRLHEAMSQGNLPNLTHLCFQDCISVVGATAVLRQSEWSTLTYLNLAECFIELVNNQPVWSSSKLPNLENLSVFCHCETDEGTISTLFQTCWPNLRRFFVDNITEQGDKELLAALREGKLSNLTEFGLSLSPQRKSVINLKLITHFLKKLQFLTFQKCFGPLGEIEFTDQLREIDISHNPSVTVELSSLLSSQFPSLNTLALSNCGLNIANLSFLAQCSVEGRLLVLRNLDVSNNPDCIGQIGHLFDAGCMWKELISLYIQLPCVSQIGQRGRSLIEDSEVVIHKIENGCLSALEELSFTVYSVKYFGTEEPRALLSHLKKIKILVELTDPFSIENIYLENDTDFMKNHVDHPVLQPLYHMVRRNLFPALRNVFVVTPTGIPPAVVVAADMYFFSKNNIRLNISETVDETLESDSDEFFS